MPKHEKVILIIAVAVLAVLVIAGETPFSKDAKNLFGSTLVASDALTSEANPTAPVFTDIPADHPNAKAISYLKSHNILKGYEDGSFGPDKTINRAEIMKAIVSAKTEGVEDISQYKNCFNDVHEEWFANPVCYAKTKGWVSGYEGGLFKPANFVTRAEAIKMVVAAYQLDIVKTPNGRFMTLDPALWYAPYVWTAEKAGLIVDWKDNTAENLNNNAIRLDVATLIYHTAVGIGAVPTI
jgi:hypothetical protein